MNFYYDHFIIPFIIGVAILFSIVLYKYVRWITRLPKRDKLLIRKNIFTRKTLSAIQEVILESLLHRKIFRVNPLLGYMHMSLAFGWFLLIIVGSFEAAVHLKGEFLPPHAHVFYKFFAPKIIHTESGTTWEFIMDFLLLFVLIGVALAWGKRAYSRAMGMKKSTKHTRADRIALSALWLIFPARLLAESFTSGVRGGSSFLTGSIGNFMVDLLGWNTMVAIAPYTWWLYSTVLAIFFIFMPFSRYMHIFTEIPLIFLRKYGLKSSDNKQKSFDHFQIEACSRCGICIDPCQLQSAAGIDNVQSTYFLRDRRYNKLTESVTNNCLMCGRCQVKCPVGIDLNTLRLNSRHSFVSTSKADADNRYSYLNGVDLSTGSGRVGYFAGCMTSLSPKILNAMDKIFAAAKEDIWYADKNGGICCGRPLKLSGEIEAAQKMIDLNTALFEKHKITTLVTSCPICLKVFKEDYRLNGVEILHHSEYISRLIKEGRIEVSKSDLSYTYHDPCELGRGSGVYEQPRDVISAIGNLVEMEHNRESALCCGSSLANLEIRDDQQLKIASQLGEEFKQCNADSMITSCPLCKKSISRVANGKVEDICEIVANSLK